MLAAVALELVPEASREAGPGLTAGGLIVGCSSMLAPTPGSTATVKAGKAGPRHANIGEWRFADAFASLLELAEANRFSLAAAASR